MSTQNVMSKVIEKFWETIPPAWRQTRHVIRGVALGKYQMTEGQFQVLRRIRRGIASVSTLAEASQTSRSAVSRSVDALVRRGLITRSQNPEDRRNIPLALTNEGQRVMTGIYNEAEAWLAGRFERLTPEELALSLRVMKIIQRAFAEN